ncbi:hypothetical protein HELRODRAFT_193456 [Helobdella robusta]|uniref:Uncharacterized protein n=1 Tax=Helobdella robusta TaxID=6412 RepID=T1FV03_HELRO|nr:hypothetical protein HELRODRAFT_193456 [Helobdella robusta]ESN95965.1 hypothetical protein HELRODRAFT_193456 [Helobdella robusta]
MSVAVCEIESGSCDSGARHSTATPSRPSNNPPTPQSPINPTSPPSLINLPGPQNPPNPPSPSRPINPPSPINPRQEEQKQNLVESDIKDNTYKAQHIKSWHVAVAAVVVSIDGNSIDFCTSVQLNPGVITCKGLLTSHGRTETEDKVPTQTQTTIIEFIVVARHQINLDGDTYGFGIKHAGKWFTDEQKGALRAKLLILQKTETYKINDDWNKMDMDHREQMMKFLNEIDLGKEFLRNTVMDWINFSEELKLNTT